VIREAEGTVPVVAAASDVIPASIPGIESVESSQEWDQWLPGAGAVIAAGVGAAAYERRRRRSRRVRILRRRAKDHRDPVMPASRPVALDCPN